MALTSSNSIFGRFIFMEFCKPAKVYLIIALITLLYYVIDNEDFIWIFLKSVLFISWSFLINKLCSLELNSIAWLMAILPQIIFIILTVKVSQADPRSPSSTYENKDESYSI